MQYLNVPYFKQDTIYTCGPTSLQMVLSFYGIRESESALAEELKSTAENGTYHKNMLEAVLRRGLYCYINDESNLEELRSLLGNGIPVIVRYLERERNEDHYGVVVGLSDEVVAINDPWAGERVHFSREEFIARWKCDLLGDCAQWLMAVAKEAFPLGRQYHPHGS